MLKERKKERQALKQSTLNEEDPWGWMDSGASNRYIAKHDVKHTTATGLASKIQQEG
jgi:hypothetical protein